MTDPVRVRFAPSPTGQVHIGNIRAALFNYLFARSRGGQFLLRVEDTDLERSTPEAVEALMEVMDWMELRPDEDPLFQSTRREAHLEAAERLISANKAYRHARTPEESPAVFFRIPEDLSSREGVLRDAGVQEKALTPGELLRIDHTGIDYVGVSRKGKKDPGACCRAGMADLEVLDAAGTVLFRMQDGGDFETAEAVLLRYTRREIVFQDLVKGELAKPLDAMKDLVVVRGDGSPVFHLANVCDDAEQGVTHIIRGDDHVENTFRHILLFDSLGLAVPSYAHLPMIVNDQGKPYSKRDGDAFVGDFRAKGFLPEALFNYLVLLGWSPGDDREKMNRDELITSFSLDRVQTSPARMDMAKLANLNSQYLMDLPEDLYLADVRDLLSRQPWSTAVSEETWTEIARLMRPRVKTYADVTEWAWFAGNEFVRKPAALKRGLGKAWQKEAMAQILDQLETGSSLETAVQQVTADRELQPGKLNQPLRVCLTGEARGPDLDTVLTLLDPAGFTERIRTTLDLLSSPEVS